MASAGLLKLLNSGIQDERLLPPRGAIAESFDKVYVKGGRFTTEWYRVEFDNAPAFGQTARCTIPRRGQLISRAFLMVKMPDIRTRQLVAVTQAQSIGKTFVGPSFGWTNSIGHALVSQSQMIIGGSVIDTIDGKLMEVLDEFHTPLEKVTTLNRMIGRHDNGFTDQSNGRKEANQELAIPLPFWFTRDPSEALPIDAIGAEQVQITTTFNTLDNLFFTSARSSEKSAIKSSADALTGICETEGSTSMPSMVNSPFYVEDPSGNPVAGLTGDPSVFTKVSPLEVTMQSDYKLQEAYMLFEYIHLDAPEANRLRLGDLSYPIVQHYAVHPFDTKGLPTARIPMRIPNLTRDLYFFAHRKDADLFNAPFLATRDLSLSSTNPSTNPSSIPWWPDASGLDTAKYSFLQPAYSRVDSEPLKSISLSYEGRFIRYASDTPALFRSMLPSIEHRKTPWHNKYYYTLPFGTARQLGISNPVGMANLDKIQNVELNLTFQPFAGTMRETDVPQYTIYVWAETYNILRVYGGRAGLLFSY